MRATWTLSHARSHTILLGLNLAVGALLFAQFAMERLTFSQDKSTAVLKNRMDAIGLNRYMEVVGVHREQRGAVLRLKFNTPDGFRNTLYEKTFEDHFGMTVFEKLFLSYSVASGLSISRLEAQGPGMMSCDYTIVWTEKGRVREAVNGCLAAVFSTKIETSLPTSLATATNGKTPKQCTTTDL